MQLNVSCHLDYTLPEPTDLLLQVEVPHLADQRTDGGRIELSPTQHFERVPAEGDMGERIWLRAEGAFRCDYRVQVTVDRPTPEIASLQGVPPHQVPGAAVRYLMPSRYCPSDLFQNFVTAEFGELQGGARIAAMRDWVHGALAYVPGASGAQTTALDSFVQRQGVCRDFAHVMITLARASAIPARFASVYAPDVKPQDFHAVAEVFLDGGWHLVDATGMAAADTIARIGVGQDAADVAFLSAFGPITMVDQSVTVQRVTG
ncbi:transglutaminase-like domain-containing protein [Actibacterium ureilyticum]|uniref:transglutaminase-like domain-containing protein n=1 Tax=Actibacterium ureilyticum TaxID=1590614 RepID=UPI000BAB21EC|nr:transglutaminase family protein [Actibacterium ureilyticum]